MIDLDALERKARERIAHRGVPERVSGWTGPGQLAWFLAAEDALALIAELRASRKVVELAKSYRVTCEEVFEDGGNDHNHTAGLAFKQKNALEDLDAALAELEALK